MIVTLTANPSIDRTLELSARLSRGDVQQYRDGGDQAGGKGLNVARAVSAAGIPAVAVVPCAESDGFLDEVVAAGVTVETVTVPHPVRINLTLSEPDGTTTKVNGVGSPLDDAAAQGLIDVTVDRALGAAWLVLAGSVPPGPGADFYSRIAHEVVKRAAAQAVSRPFVAVDGSGDHLAALTRSAAPIDLIKPNAHELSALLRDTGIDHNPLSGDDLERSLEASADAALLLLDAAPSIGGALVTLGAAGALLVTRQGVWGATPPPITAISTVGAGDSSLAGYIIASLEKQQPHHRLARAVAYGAAAASLPGSTVPHPHHTTPHLVTVTELRRTAAAPTGKTAS